MPKYLVKKALSKKNKFTPITAIPGSTIIPTREGCDIYTRDKRFDGHIRLEKQGSRLVIAIDVFDSKIDDPKDAQIDSVSFLNSDEGTKRAEEYLRKGTYETVAFGFDYKIMKGT
ncbi:MAG: hypothetical protein ACYCQJ_10475 [Nitrososphaerales archaeon]